MEGGPNFSKTSVISLRRASILSEENSYDDVILEPLLSPQVLHMGHYENGKSSIDKVKQILDSDDESVLDPRPLFCEMLYFEDNSHQESTKNLCWKESSRWVKYEETVEEGGTRWSKPHVTLLTVQQLLQIRNTFNKGLTLFDVSVENFAELTEICLHNWSKRHYLTPSDVDVIRKILSAPKQHLVGNKHRIIGTSTSSANDDAAVLDGYLEDHQKSIKSNLQVFFARRSASDNDLNNADTVTKSSKINQSLFRKLPDICETACLMVGYVDILKQSLSFFVRLKSAKLFLDVTELPISTRFVYILLIPSMHAEIDARSIGRCLGTLMVDEVFSKVAYKARNGAELGCAVEEFLNQSIIIPAGKWNKSVRWEPAENQPPVERCVEETFDLPALLFNASMDEHCSLRRTGRCFGGFIDDMKLKLYWYKSDFMDAFRGRQTQSLAAAIFLFFANISKIITFGGVMDHQLHKEMGAIENVLAGGVCGMIYALMSGQPLCVLSATGPCLVFEVVLYNLCKNMNWTFLIIRAWVGIWTAAFLVFYVAIDASVLVGLITRFTEEAFATMISLIFLVKAVDELMEIKHDYPIAYSPEKIVSDPCLCYFGNSSLKSAANSTDYANFNNSEVYSTFTGKQCLEAGGVPKGVGCNYSPEIFMFSIILMFSTFIISLALKFFRHTSFFTSKIRNVVADFNAIIAICLMTLVNYFVGIKVPCLNVPERFEPTSPRPWIVNPMEIEHWWIALLAIFPAAFFSILVMMDQNITSVIINRPDNKLKKGYGYHLDLAVISLLMIICSLLGLPFYVAATVISLLHVDSLRLMSETAAPGEKPRFLGIKEQRVTAFLAHMFIGLAVVLTPVMKLLPMPVLLGVFLYIGIVSLSGQQFGQRILLLFMPMKHQPDYSWLRSVRMKRVHLFTGVQLVSFIFLLIVEENKKISMIFPLMLFVMVLIRKILMEKIFTQKELIALDDPLPSWGEMFRAAPKKQNNNFNDDNYDPAFYYSGDTNNYKNNNYNEKLNRNHSDKRRVNGEEELMSLQKMA